MLHSTPLTPRTQRVVLPFLMLSQHVAQSAEHWTQEGRNE